MVFSLICLVLVLAIALRQGTQGLFSGMIMLLLTICCAAAAFGTYEWVGVKLLVPLWRPDYALPIALAVLFGIPLLVLRLVFDRLIRRACLLPSWADRAGGGVCGLLIGLIVVGVAATAVQMVPFGNGSILGYSRVTVVDLADRADPSVEPFGPDSRERELLLRPDRCAIGLASLLSSGVFSGKESFGMRHPDMIQTIGWVGAAHAEVSRFAPPGSISIARTEPVQFVYQFDPGNRQRGEPAVYEPQTPKPGYEFRMVRVRLSNAARDTRKSHVFMLRQFRLVGQVGMEEAYVQYHPIALQQADAADATNRHVRAIKSGPRFWPVTDERYSPREDNQNEVEIVFELPTGFKPAFLEYKREARVAFSFDQPPATADAGRARRSREPAATPPAPSPAPAPTSQPEATTSTGTPPAPADRTDTGSDRRRGRVRTATAEQQTGSRFGDELPLALTSYESKENFEAAREALRQGHVIADVSAQSGGTNAPLRRFAVPDDKRLLQLHVGRLESRSTLGRALSRAVETVQNYFVTDDSGNRFTLVGKYAVANVGRQNIIEIQYFPDSAGMMGSGVRMPFDRIRPSRLRPNDTFVLLFLVDPGAHIVSFSTGGDATRQDDLTGQNLTAPQ